MSTDDQDAELLALCTEFHRLLAAATQGDKAAVIRRWKVEDRLQAMPARSIEDLQAKAAVAVALMIEQNGGDQFGSAEERFVVAVLRDLAAVEYGRVCRLRKPPGARLLSSAGLKPTPARRLPRWLPVSRQPLDVGKTPLTDRLAILPAVRIGFGN
jgi:hypothetical protein